MPAPQAQHLNMPMIVRSSCLCDICTYLSDDEEEDDSEKMMNELNTELTVSVFDVNFDRQAMNLSVDHLSEAVRPWFEDWNDVSIRRAIENLDVPALRDQAAAYLGLELQIAA